MHRDTSTFPSPIDHTNPNFPEHEHLKCPRCDSGNTKFCYYNNYNLSQPRHFCKNCRRYWTKGGTLRNIPVGGATRKITKRSSISTKRDSPPFTDSPLQYSPVKAPPTTESPVSAPPQPSLSTKSPMTAPPDPSTLTAPSQPSLTTESPLTARPQPSPATALPFPPPLQPEAQPEAQSETETEPSIVCRLDNYPQWESGSGGGGFRSVKELGDMLMVGSNFNLLRKSDEDVLIRNPNAGDFGTNFLRLNDVNNQTSGSERGESSCWNGEENGWPDLSIVTPSSSFH